MNHQSKIQDDYFSWLYSIVRGNKDYRTVSYELHGYPFEYTINLDENRMDDGYSLRGKFLSESDITERMSEEILSLPVSVFEVIVALCDRMDFMLDLLDGVRRHHIWYDELLHNIDLDKFDGSVMLSDYDEVYIDEVVRNLLDRTYDRWGNGSLFPVTDPIEGDVRTVELWYQLAHYINEHHPV